MPTIDRQRAAGAEIILHVDDQQQGILHFAFSAAAQPLKAGNGSVIT
jgi:hypothetical protein